LLTYSIDKKKRESYNISKPEELIKLKSESEGNIFILNKGGTVMPEKTERQKRKEKSQKRAAARAMKKLRVLNSWFKGNYFYSKTVMDYQEGCKRYSQIWLGNDSGRLALQTSVVTDLDENGDFFQEDFYQYITISLPVSMAEMLGSEKFGEVLETLYPQMDTYDFLALSTAHRIMKQ
jgi:hypothetical protein